MCECIRRETNSRKVNRFQSSQQMVRVALVLTLARVIIVPWHAPMAPQIIIPLVKNVLPMITARVEGNLLQVPCLRPSVWKKGALCGNAVNLFDAIETRISFFLFHFQPNAPLDILIRRDICLKLEKPHKDLLITGPNH